jgi:hypothetical protein
MGNPVSIKVKELLTWDIEAATALVAIGPPLLLLPKNLVISPS